MVGTVYLSAEPGSKPFVAVGDSVSEGQTLLIIEAMKVMNQIQAPRSGTVTRICVQNAEPVEFGQALVVIE
jgi:acetyl-CoA carboxylase biotin carboxyl carrier protein